MLSRGSDAEARQLPLHRPRELGVERRSTVPQVLIQYRWHVEKVGAYLRDGESPPHHGQDTVDVVRSESIGIFGAVEVSNPEAR